MRILAVADNIQSGIADIRLRTPLVALARRNGWSVEFSSVADCRPRWSASFDAFILQRGTTRRAANLQQVMADNGCATVYEIDDLLLQPDSHLNDAGMLVRRTRWIKRGLMAADVVTASTARLAAAIGSHAGHVQVVPNYAPTGCENTTARHESNGVCCLLVASSDSLSVPFLLSALRLLRHDVRIVAVGPPGEWLERAGFTLNRMPVLPRREFLEFAGSLSNPVALMPLEESAFTACKSAIKWFDYSTIGIPVICSNVSPYRDVIEDGMTGVLVPNDAASWTQAIDRATSDVEWRRNIAATAKAVVQREHGLDRTVDAWERAMAEALRRRNARALPRPSMRRHARMLLAEAENWLRSLNRKRLARRR